MNTLLEMLMQGIVLFILICLVIGTGVYLLKFVDWLIDMNNEE